MIDLLAWVAAAVALIAYFLLASGEVGLRVFNWSEFVASIPLAVSAIHHAAYPALAITLSYGAIGLFGLVWGTNDHGK